MVICAGRRTRDHLFIERRCGVIATRNSVSDGENYLRDLCTKRYLGGCLCAPSALTAQDFPQLFTRIQLAQALIRGVAYRVVNVCTGDLGTVAAKKYGLEAWFPGQGAYREVVSCSNCTAYQAVRSNIRYRDRPDEPTKFVHTLNSTLVATERALAAIMETYQQRDGTIVIPEALRPYMNGLDLIRG